ncbi:hypothetical protein N7533_005085 [Penicillium manginii]|uniref:uncharacterized protein n=1 Tax=Penicillium manginii TaxID=203109 RepID=UPI0025489908|nr:uncharacterized protein N7533_005085 [Penicillium manginii]KAJ5755542.1 hypothetical protein N7533_005085 [Penicillium manginii]
MPHCIFTVVNLVERRVLQHAPDAKFGTLPLSGISVHSEALRLERRTAKAKVTRRTCYRHASLQNYLGYLVKLISMTSTASCKRNERYPKSVGPQG